MEILDFSKTKLSKEDFVRQFKFIKSVQSFFLYYKSVGAKMIIVSNLHELLTGLGQKYNIKTEDYMRLKYYSFFLKGYQKYGFIGEIYNDLYKDVKKLEDCRVDKYYKYIKINQKINIKGKEILVRGFSFLTYYYTFEYQKEELKDDDVIIKFYDVLEKYVRYLYHIYFYLRETKYKFKIYKERMEKKLELIKKI